MTPDPAPWECPRCHCLFERPRSGHEPCGDPVSVTLAEAKRIADTLAFACRIPDKVPDFTACGGPAAEAYWAYFTPARIVSLLAAVGRVLEMAAEWSAESAGLEGGHRGLADHGADKLRTAMYARSVALQDCADQFREAITAALTGQEAGDGLETRP